MAARKKVEVAVDPARDAEFDRAFELLRDLVDWSAVDQQFPVRGNAVYTTGVVLWMLVSQRMSPERSLESAVKRLIDTQPDFLPDNKRITEKTLSNATGGYSRARSRLQREAAQWFAERVRDSLIEATAPSFDGRRVYLVDGTTITLAPEPVLRREFPPASNQHGVGVWPVALLVVAHELSSGAALIPSVGAMYGEHAVSETALARDLLVQMPDDGIVMADAGFGIFAVAWDARQTNRDFVFRLSESRFTALRRKATIVASGENWTTYSHTWRPSAKERQTHPDLPLDAVIEVRLHEIRIHDTLTLCLVTSLPHTATELSELYRHRGDVEVDIRNLKVVLNTERIQARSVEMFHKELLTSLVAYNLVTQFRRQAAALIAEPPRRMSFKRTWTTFNIFLWSSQAKDASGWRAKYRQALLMATQDKLPNRPGRSFAREAYPRRPKSNQFQKRRPKNPEPKPDS